MKKTILSLTVLCLLLLGCTPVDVQESKETAVSQENIAEIIDDFDDGLAKLILLVNPAIAYEHDVKSKSLVMSHKSKISEFNSNIGDVEKQLADINKLDFEGKQEFVSAYNGLIDVTKEIVSTKEEMLNYELDFIQQRSLEEKTKVLMDSVANCRCAEVDCEAHLQSTLEYMDDSIKIFRNIKAKYGLKSFDKIIAVWETEKAIVERHMPKLIQESASFGPSRCYRLGDLYSRYAAEFDNVEYVTEEELADDVTEKWDIPLTELGTKREQLAIDVESAFNMVMGNLN